MPLSQDEFENVINGLPLEDEFGDVEYSNTGEVTPVKVFPQVIYL